MTLRILQRQNTRRSFTSTGAALKKVSKSNTNANSNSKASGTSKPRVLAKPDRFRPPSHPQRLTTPSPKNAPPGQPFEYGPRITEKERIQQSKTQYPGMFPPEGTVMFKFLTSKWIHIWIAMSVLISCAGFTFTTNFKATSPFAHLLPSWSSLLTSPFSTISQAFAVWRMHVQHNSMRVREQRHRRVEDAEKRKEYRVAHGLEKAEPEKKDEGVEVDSQSPVAAGAAGEGAEAAKEFVDWEGNKRPVKKWLGIW
ncbi:hypothetical protein DTO013E5_7875 [Penicillium roqueforti]|nr:uncharacterized protein LCP9604111_9184 [Penicillium roqueforti]KAF9239189.1 hypothetical protein LCP9604111_9184 [Penicillium roqueforti]KAI1833927.1 hypothetical protein CBS147337_5482 [Penicillium roqueforti]KAI2685822.1 hypothetical protein CBS147355_1309 [Penicillium roqueforti]KAI2692016.1 hypothetical protein LCP963914a_110 [Penicillium roqueforti]KAI2718061.1 hypothetical protein CBS147318_4638 [Penicillium roqueforti]